MEFATGGDAKHAIKLARFGKCRVAGSIITNAQWARVGDKQNGIADNKIQLQLV